MSGIELIAKERVRQVSMWNWTPAHDDTHNQGELAQAASCYVHAAAMSQLNDGKESTGEDQAEEKMLLAQLWPFNESELKMDPDPLVNLAKAGAMIAAEMDRLIRLRVKEQR